MDGDEERVLFYLQRAEEVRAIADTMKDKHTRKTLCTIADDYEIMAASMRRVAKTDQQLKLVISH